VLGRADGDGQTTAARETSRRCGRRVTSSGRDAKFGRPLRLFSAPLPFAGPGRSYVVLPNGNFLMKTLADDVAARSSIVVLNWTAELKK
jgi:hypothetical protein